MLSQTIAQLAWYMPYSEETVRQAQNIRSTVPVERIYDIVHYSNCHKNLQFGWDFAQALAQNEECTFPAVLHGDDLYVWRAYNFIKGYDDPVIASALSLTLPENEMLANQIKALLVADDITTGYIAQKLGLDESAVQAYEKLFFNVLDRKKDHAFLAQVVYPEGRLVEAAEDYIERTGMADILLRAGFTRGADHIFYAMGLTDNPYGKKDVNDIATTLDKTFLADGCVFATLGWANQKRNSRPILNARASMIAGKMGKNDQESGGLPTVTPGDIMRMEINTMAEKKLEARSRILQQQREGIVIDVTPS